MLKIIGIQLVVLITLHLFMYPTTKLASFAKKIFGDYSTALLMITGTQIIALAITFVIFLFIN